MKSRMARREAVLRRVAGGLRGWGEHSAQASHAEKVMGWPHAEEGAMAERHPWVAASFSLSPSSLGNG